MDGISRITKRIESDTDAQVQEILNDAKQRAEQEKEIFVKETEQKCAQMKAKGEKDAIERISRLKSVAELESRQMMLGAKQDMLSEAFEEALKALCALPEEQYIDLLARLAADSASDGEGEVLLSASDRARFGKKVVTRANERLKAQGISDRLKLAEETRDIKGGLYVRNGNVEANCSFETIIRMKRETLALPVAKILFD